MKSVSAFRTGSDHNPNMCQSVFCKIMGLGRSDAWILKKVTTNEVRKWISDWIGAQLQHVCFCVLQDHKCGTFQWVEIMTRL